MDEPMLLFGFASDFSLLLQRLCISHSSKADPLGSSLACSSRFYLLEDLLSCLLQSAVLLRPFQLLEYQI